MTMTDVFGRPTQVTPEQKRQQDLDTAWMNHVRKLKLESSGPNTGPEDFRAMLRDPNAKKAFTLQYNQENQTKDLNNLTPEQQARLNEVTIRNQELASELERSKSPEAQEQARIDRARKERAKDLSEGRTRGEELFAEGSLGRISPELLDQIRAQSKGFSAEEQTALREQNLGNLQQQNAAQLRQLKIQQAQQGVRGGQATAQRARALSDISNQMATGERELFLKNIDARRSGQQALLGAEQYQNEQGNRERMARLTTELGYGALGSADRAAAIQAIIGKQQADAAARSGGGGGKK